MPSQTKRLTIGFTLIEVMIVVAIVGILAAVAYPSYTEYVNRGRRAQAQTALLEDAQYMQRYYASNGSYAADVAGTANPFNTDTNLTRVPREVGSPQTYIVGLATVASPPGFVLTAAPSPGSTMVNDKCGNFTIDATGLKGIANQPAGSAATVQDCWK